MEVDDTDFLNWSVFKQVASFRTKRIRTQERKAEERGRMLGRNVAKRVIHSEFR